MSAAQRSIQADSTQRQLGAAFAAVVLAAALLLAVAYGQLAGSKTALVPAAGPAPAVHDHGWSSDSRPIDGTSSGSPTGGTGGGNGTRFAQ